MAATATHNGTQNARQHKRYAPFCWKRGYIQKKTLQVSEIRKIPSTFFFAVKIIFCMEKL